MELKFEREYLKLDKMKIKDNRVDYYFSISKNLNIFFVEELHLFIEYDQNIEDVPKSILVIPFVANIIPLMWLTNATLWVEEIDRKYYDSIVRVKNIYQDMYQNYKLTGRIIAAKTINNEYEYERKALQLFSGGLDAVSTTIRIEDKNPILVNIYSWYEKEIKENKIFNSDKKNISEFSLKNNLESKFIKSNFATAIKADKVNKFFKKKLGDSWWHGLQHGMLFIGHAIPLAYKYNVENIYIASSFSIGGVRYSCSSDPAIDIEIKYASGGVIHDGLELRRQDKIKLIIEKQKKINKDYILRVCSFNDKNCCKCEKCFRTILGLIAEGISKEGLVKFGFEIEGDLKTYFSNLMEEKIHLWGVEREYKIHWPEIKEQINNNIDNIYEREFIKWFLSYDFIGSRKKNVFKYRVRKFFPILKRKLLRSKYEN